MAADVATGVENNKARRTCLIENSASRFLPMPGARDGVRPPSGG